MVFFSGHGWNDSNNFYYFLPSNFDSNKVRSTGLRSSEIRDTVNTMAGKVIFFMDSCHSGNVLGTGKSKAANDITAVVNELSRAENGAVVFCASTGNQLSWEDPAWQNGAFTKAVIEGLQAKASPPQAEGDTLAILRAIQVSSKLTITMLDAYVSERVKQLTNGKQTPTGGRPTTIPDYAINVRR